jgi:hypothetical protein
MPSGVFRSHDDAQVVACAAIRAASATGDARIEEYILDQLSSLCRDLCRERLPDP